MYQVHIRQYVAAKRGKAGNKTRSPRRITTTAKERYKKALREWKKSLEDEQQTEQNNERS